MVSGLGKLEHYCSVGGMVWAGFWLSTNPERVDWCCSQGARFWHWSRHGCHIDLAAHPFMNFGKKYYACSCCLCILNHATTLSYYYLRERTSHFMNIDFVHCNRKHKDYSQKFEWQWQSFSKRRQNPISSTNCQCLGTRDLSGDSCSCRPVCSC